MNMNVLLKGLMKLAAGLVILLLLVIGVFVGINIKDQPPSAAAIEFQQAWDNRAPVPDNDNGYIYLLGFDVEEASDPIVVGLERIRWASEAIKDDSKENLNYPQPRHNLQQQLSTVMNESLEHCKQINLECIDVIEKKSAEIAAEQTSGQWLEKRYHTLITHPAWLELSVLDIRLPLPNYGDVIKAQRLVFMRAFATGDANAFKMLANQDLYFWRMMLANTDTLIGKMVAAAAIKNNFAWINFFLRKQDASTLDAAIPDLLNQPFTEAELSLYRSIAGEWVFGNTGYLQLEELSDKPAERFAAKLLLKKQDTSNRIADRLKRLLDQVDVPVHEFESAWENREAPQTMVKRPAALHYVLNPYNPVGKILVEVASPAYDNYVARVKDLEVFRLGLLSAVATRRAPETGVVKTASLYKKYPFAVDEARRSVTVTGYGNGPQGEQVFFY